MKMFEKIKSMPLYPFLFVLYPLLALLGFNISEVSANVVWRPMGVLLLAMTVLFGLLFLLMRAWHRAGISASIVGLLFFTYGHAYGYLKAIEIGGVILGRHRQLLPLWVGLGVLSCWWAWKKLKRPDSLVPTLNMVAAFLLVFPVYQISSKVLQDYLLRRGESNQLKESAAELPLGYAPDIYYIILDGYGRADSLQTIFGYDNSQFIESLRSRGFYVAQCSQSNYSQTILSISSALNLNYVDQVLEDVNEGASDKSVLLIMGQYNLTRKKLDAMGYNIISFKTNFPISEWRDADYYFEPTLPGMNDFELVLAQTTALRIPMDFMEQSPEKRTSEWYRRRTTFVLEQLEDEVPKIPGPKFVFAHLIIPHRPFVFGPNGEEVAEEFYQPGVMSYDTLSTGYVNQVLYINKQMEQTVDIILEKSARPPIIIIQGDHGPDLGSVKDRSRLDESIHFDEHRMYNLNAYYFPDGPSGLYETITPVNSFRLIFSKYFGENHPTLEDVAHYSAYKSPYKYAVMDNRCEK